MGDDVDVDASCAATGRLTSPAQMVLPAMLQLITQVEDDPDWATRRNLSADNADDDDDISTTAAQAIDRLARSLGGKTFLNHTIVAIQTMLQPQQPWQVRHGALMAISAMAEGCVDVMLPSLDVVRAGEEGGRRALPSAPASAHAVGPPRQLVDAIIAYATDPHPRVRYAVCHALGQLATDFAPHYEERFHHKILPVLGNILALDPCARVQAHAAAALVNFVDDLPKELLGPYLDDIVGKLAQTLSSNIDFLRDQSVVTLATIAQTAEEAFAKYYGVSERAVFVRSGSCAAHSAGRWPAFSHRYICAATAIDSGQCPHRQASAAAWVRRATVVAAARWRTRYRRENRPVAYASSCNRPAAARRVLARTHTRPACGSRAVECISLIGAAVGKEKFHTDAIKVMQITAAAFGHLSSDDMQVSYILPAWSRICKACGAEEAGARGPCARPPHRP